MLPLAPLALPCSDQRAALHHRRRTGTIGSAADGSAVAGLDCWQRGAAAAL